MLSELKRRITSYSNPSVNQRLEKKLERLEEEYDVEAEVLVTPTHANKRILYYEYGCEFCKKYIEIVDRFNDKLDRRAEPIRKVDVDGVEPEKDVDIIEGSPTLYLDGILIKGITTRGFGEGFLKGYLEDEMVID